MAPNGIFGSDAGTERAGALSAIVMKLLPKTAEERYQTAAGVEADLRRSLEEWDSHGRIDPYPLGACDVSDRLLIPEKLYGVSAPKAVPWMSTANAMY